ncbi:hypothetical protein BD560DRAFT_413527 [Blakeslea trispora]|nr:hypothetical protein BD560DRAFT_413527 [Blakeslea trispora]
MKLHVSNSSRIIWLFKEILFFACFCYCSAFGQLVFLLIHQGIRKCLFLNSMCSSLLFTILPMTFIT